MINLNILETKIKSLQDKDLDNIIAKKIYISTLGTTYTKSKLRNWINKRLNFLIIGRDSGETALTTQKDLIYSQLTVRRKRIADKELAGEEVVYESEADWEALVLIRLYVSVRE
jgi:hypothetical protein